MPITIKVGTEVITPEGRRAIVQDLQVEHYGSIGRPPTWATVKLFKIRGSGFSKIARSYWIKDLRKAA